jgi:hypothetical protein
MYTNTEIFDMVQDLPAKAAIRKINDTFRAMDESHLWPVNNKFNATERAIRRVRDLRRRGICIDDYYDYILTLDSVIDRVVNDAV